MPANGCWVPPNNAFAFVFFSIVSHAAVFREENIWAKRGLVNIEDIVSVRSRCSIVATGSDHREYRGKPDRLIKRSAPWLSSMMSSVRIPINSLSDYWNWTRSILFHPSSTMQIRRAHHNSVKTKISIEFTGCQTANQLTTSGQWERVPPKLWKICFWCWTSWQIKIDVYIHNHQH